MQKFIKLGRFLVVFLRISVLLTLNLERASKYLSWTAVLHCLLFLF